MGKELKRSSTIAKYHDMKGIYFSFFKIKDYAKAPPIRITWNHLTPSCGNLNIHDLIHANLSDVR